MCGSGVHSTGNSADRRSAMASRSPAIRATASPRKRTLPFGQRRLVGKGGDGAETVAAGNIGCGEDGDDAGMVR